ncbi:hypothetical protein PP1_007935 [Pseudonocardia sp. P1]
MPRRDAHPHDDVVERPRALPPGLAAAADRRFRRVRDRRARPRGGRRRRAPEGRAGRRGRGRGAGRPRRLLGGAAGAPGGT